MAKAGSELRLDGSGNPVWLLLELTYQCPLQCVFCSNPRNFADYRPHELSTAEWIDVMAQARAMGAMQIGFSGGEPTLRKDLETLVAEADRMGYYTNLITSGIGLTEEKIASFAEAGLDHPAHRGFVGRKRPRPKLLALHVEPTGEKRADPLALIGHDAALLDGRVEVSHLAGDVAPRAPVDGLPDALAVLPSQIHAPMPATIGALDDRAFTISTSSHRLLSLHSRYPRM